MRSGRAGHVAPAATCLLLTLLSAAFGTRTGASQSEDEAALRSLVTRYYEALAARDLDRASATWSTKSPQRAAKLKELKQRAAQTGSGAVTILDVRRVRAEGDNASLRVEIEAGAAMGKPGADLGKSTFDLECIREEGRWAIWREEVAQVNLAARLAALGTAEERAALVTAEHELKTPSLCLALVWSGDQLRRRGQYPRAHELYDLALSVAQEIRDRGGEADALHILGRLHFEQDEYDASVDYYRRGLALREELNDSAKVAQSLSGLAGVYVRLGKLDQALELEQRSLKLREAGGDRPAIANGLANLGYVYRNRDEIAKALDCYRKSLALLSDAGDRLGAAWMLREIGLIQYMQRDYAEALDYYGQSLKLYEGLQVKQEIAQTLYNTGIVHRALGDFDRALDCYEQSLRIRQEIGDRSGTAACFYSMANVHGARGNYSRALEHYQKQKDIFEGLGDKVNVASALNGMASVHNGQGHPDRALAFYQESLAIHRSSGQKRLIASALNNVAVSRSLLGEYDRALEGYGQSLALYEDLKDREGIARNLSNIGTVHRLRKDPIKALESLVRSLALSEELGEKEGVSLTLASISNSHFAIGNRDQAVAFATRSADTARAIGARSILWQACTVLGQAHRALRQPEKAREAFEEAIRVIEGLRREIAGGESERAGFLADKVSPYHGMVELAVDQSHGAEALSYAERAKGRVLLEVLQSGREDFDTALSAREREEERKRAAAVVSLTDRLSLEVRRKNPDQKRIAGLKADLDRARLEREAFETNAYAAHPELRVQRGELQVLTAGEAARLLPGPAGAFLEFVVMEARTFLFVVKQAGTGEAGGAAVRVYPIALGREDLGRRVERFRKQIADRNLGFRASAAGVFDLLLGPARSQLKGITSLVIVPDGPLWDLPFQALVSGGKYLWEQCEISYSPSLTVLREMAKLRERRAAARAGPAKLLALGNPVPGGTTGREAGTLAAGDGLAQLPEAEDQVKRIGSLYGSRAKVYLGAGAAEQRFKQEAEAYGIIHLATHGILVDANPMYSHVILSHGGGDDGELEAREILRLRLSAELVVLSACETARGRAGAGEGMIGLSWALFVAGCPTTVVSQWKVDAAATTDLMVEFHRLLQAARPGSRNSKAAALRQAALASMRDPRYRHPFYWAGFILVGDGS